jgi:hypothetical protein
MSVNWRKKFGLMDSSESRRPAPRGQATQQHADQSNQINEPPKPLKSIRVVSEEPDPPRSNDPKLADLRLIHVGKSGGSTVIQTLGISQYHTVKPRFKPNEQYIIWLRNPLSRFVACFNMSKYHYYWNHRSEPLRIRCGFPDLGNNPDRPERPEGSKMPILPSHYGYMINYFDSANEVAESLDSIDSRRKEIATTLMNHAYAHIASSLGWYTDSGQFIRRHKANIYFVGRQEHMDDDMNLLCDKIGIPRIESLKKWRENRYSPPESKLLSARAVANLKKHYRHDYAALDVLASLGFIDTETRESYNTYPLMKPEEAIPAVPASAAEQGEPTCQQEDAEEISPSD